MQQAEDFLQESRVLAELIEPLSANELETVTLFKNWTITDVVGHLHMFNHAAELALQGSELFQEFFAPMAKDLNAAKSLLSVQNEWLGEMLALDLIDAWRQGFENVAADYASADPKQRIVWAGPDMSARSSISARQMETWAHGQAVFDVLGIERADSDRIKNIAHLGVHTFGWTFSNRGLPIPPDAPFIQLTAPSGAVWEWNSPQDNNWIKGSATAFCQIVTQTRNVADTNLSASNGTAQTWMDTAQCFAGPPNPPPLPGTRYGVKR